MNSQQVCCLFLALAVAVASGAPQYAISYSVEVPETRDQKQAEETSQDGVTRGSYQYLRPDGVLQVVTYTVTKEGGYQAEVEERPGFAPIVLEEKTAEPQLESVETSVPVVDAPKISVAAPPTSFGVPSLTFPPAPVFPSVPASPSLPLTSVPAAPVFTEVKGTIPAFPSIPASPSLPLASIPAAPVFTEVKETAPVFTNIPVAPVFSSPQAPAFPSIAQALVSAGETDISSVDFQSPVVTFNSPHVSYTYFDRV